MHNNAGAAANLTCCLLSFYAWQVFDSSARHFITKTWRDIQVGDVIIVKKGEYFPADLLFLSAENTEGICYVETMQLDGETNLKIRKSLDETKDLRHDSIGNFAGRSIASCTSASYSGAEWCQQKLLQHLCQAGHQQWCMWGHLCTTLYIAYEHLVVAQHKDSAGVGAVLLLP